MNERVLMAVVVSCLALSACSGGSSSRSLSCQDFMDGDNQEQLSATRDYVRAFAEDHADDFDDDAVEQLAEAIDAGCEDEDGRASSVAQRIIGSLRGDGE